ncbi:hypothetical protein [Dysosmobacter sp.]
MAGHMDFGEYAQELDLDGLSRERLEEYLDIVWKQIGRLDEQEPEDMESEDYEEWGERHEELEDLADEIQDRLEELGGPHG